MLISLMTTLLQFAAICLALATMAFVAQAAAAIFLSDRPFRTSSSRPRITVLVPAHNEEQMIEATLLRIKEDLWPSDRLLVIADNCIDQTAQLAARTGADIVVRDDSGRRGKGFALAAGLRHLAATPPEVVIFIDADCQVGPHSVELLARACAAADGPVQCLNLMVADPASSASPPRLAEFAWRIKNDFRPTGYARLGLPCQLLGTGMAVPWTLIQPERFATGHLSEDMLFGLELAMEGHPPRFFRVARVTSYFPDSQHGREQQRQRWVHGHLGLIYSHVPRLIYNSLRRRDIGLLALAFDLAVPPLGVLAVADLILAMSCLIFAAVTGASAPLGLAMLGCALFSFCLATTWCVCGRDLVGAKEIKQLPRHLMLVMRSALNLVLGHKAQWIRADRLRTSIHVGRPPHR